MKFNYFAWATRKIAPTDKVYTPLEHLVYGAFSFAAIAGLIAVVYGIGWAMFH